MTHTWDRTHAGRERKGGILVRACLQCGVEEVRHNVQRFRTWYLNGAEHKVGISPPECEAAPPTYTVFVSPERWIVRSRRGHGKVRIVAHGRCETVAAGFAEAAKVVKP